MTCTGYHMPHNIIGPDGKYARIMCAVCQVEIPAPQGHTFAALVSPEPSDERVERLVEALKRVIDLTSVEPDEHAVSAALRLLPIRQIARAAIASIAPAVDATPDAVERVREAANCRYTCPEPLDRDTARIELWKAMRASGEISTETDDKIIIERLEVAGIHLCALPEGSS